MALLICFVLLQFFVHFTETQNCFYANDTKSAFCNNLTCYNRLKREVIALSLKNSCNLEIDDWNNFTHTLPNLHTLSFDPYCPNCLKIDENFDRKLQVQGRCLEKPSFKSVDLSEITKEIAACLAFLILLTILYIVKFVKQEIAHFFTQRH